MAGDSAWRALALDSTLALRPRATPASVAPVDYATLGCPGSLRLAQGRDRTGRTLTVAVWWVARSDSSARLVSAVSPNDGATWAPAVAVDSGARNTHGCARPPAAVAFDGRTGYVHVAYFLEASEGPGVFFSHSMDEGQLFHAPVPIVYGERPGDVAIAVAGDTVAVAYEDPNAPRPRVALALSRTQGHLFERKGLAASGDDASAESPRVALRGTRLAVAWLERAASGATTAVVRRGRMGKGALE